MNQIKAAIKCNKNKGNTAESGYNAWLGYPFTAEEFLKGNVQTVINICVKGNDPLLGTACEELKSALTASQGITPALSMHPAAGSIVLELLSDKPAADGNTSGTTIAASSSGSVTLDERKQLDPEGFIIKYCTCEEGRYLLIAGKSGAAVLYGVFGFLRHLQCSTVTADSVILENPSIKLRMLNHWDNMDGSIERGYAGESIFYKDNTFLPDADRISDYARLMASVGLNAIVLNNVNVHTVETRLITKDFLPDVAKVATLFRNYGIKTFLSINYSSPMELGGLPTADPLDKDVASWWKEKAAEIYSYIPDFGGFLVKADSEFRPGPFTYGRNHAEGANMLAKALEPYGGLVIWRCFVYNCKQDWRDRVTDRANAAYDNFMPLDGLFADNVLLQIKNGPMDFQVREPVSPLLGGLKNTNVLLEFQIAQEYTGQQRHLCYLAPMWKEVLDFDTCSHGNGSTVNKLLTDTSSSGRRSGIAAVSNIGSDTNWTGHDLAQANLYCFGRLAWDPGLSSMDIAREWTVQTFGGNSVICDTVCGMLMDSRSIYENYTSPLGIGWMVNPNNHYGPSVDGYEYSAWGTYHRADHLGIGVDRSVAGGTGYAGRYHAPVSAIYETPETCPEELLLFFHHIPYSYRLKSGKTLIQYIYDTHFEGAEKAADLVQKWKSLKGLVSPGCFDRVMSRLQEQAAHACEWRDVVNTYFYRKSGIADEKNRKIY